MKQGLTRKERAAFYRMRAEEAERDAINTNCFEAQAQFLKFAEEWRKLADEVEKVSEVSAS